MEYLKYTLNSLIYWDKITYMPEEGIEYRTKVMSYLADKQYKLMSGTKFAAHVKFFKNNKRNDKDNRFYGEENMPKFRIREQSSRRRIQPVYRAGGCFRAGVGRG